MKKNECYRPLQDDSKLLVHSDLSIRQALKSLDETSEKVLFVIDDKKRLIGCLTDGDIRRALLSDKKIDEPIQGIYNSAPKKIMEDDYDDNKIKDLLLKNRIEVLPVIDSIEMILGYVTWEDSFGEIRKEVSEKICLPLVIMAGGKGTRMAPFTNVLPKPLIPIGDKTILEVIMEEFAFYGVTSYYFTLNYRGGMIKAYFDGLEKGYDISYIWEESFNGTASSLGLIKDIDTDFIVSNCDIIVKADYSEVYKFHKESGAYLTVISSIQHQQFPYGVIEFQSGGEVTGLREKPEFTFPINTGVYILSPKCFDLIPENEFFHMTHLIEKLINDGKKVVTFPVNENDFIDTGQWDEYKSAVERLI